MSKEKDITLSLILKDSNYNLSLFPEADIKALARKGDGSIYIDRR